MMAALVDYTFRVPLKMGLELPTVKVLLNREVTKNFTIKAPTERTN